MQVNTTIVWFRRDFRLADHPALADAAARGPVVAVVILEDGEEAGGAARWWMHHSLAALAKSLAVHGIPLVLRMGDAAVELPRLAAETGARRVAWNRRPEPHRQRREQAVAAALAAAGVEPCLFAPDLLFEPGRIRSRSGKPFRTFADFWRAALALPPPFRPLPAPPRLAGPAVPPRGLSLDELGLMPRIRWDDGLAESWSPGEVTAQARLADFAGNDLEQYLGRREIPDQDGTSCLSPHLAFGEVSPRQVWHAVTARPPSSGSEGFLRNLGWREFSHTLLAGFPDLPERPMRPEFAAFPWTHDTALEAAWRRGQTGYPIVDAGMRQLRRTGWMHNRVRMVVASFLVKDLLVPWQRGLAWFADELVDADTAINAASWQWSAGCGVDAAPWFRIFNPVLQGEKFDPGGHYVRRWVPELAGLPAPAIHRPWETAMFRGRYPAPVVDHAAARRRALDAYARIKGTATPKPAA